MMYTMMYYFDFNKNTSKTQTHGTFLKKEIKTIALKNLFQLVSKFLDYYKCTYTIFP